MNREQRSIMKKIDRVLREHGDELVSSKWRDKRKAGAHYTTGLCYVASEAFYHLAKDDSLKPCVGRVRGNTHWWLENVESGEIIDLTGAQFESRKLREAFYSAGKGCGFLTKEPSKRAQALLRHIPG